MSDTKRLERMRDLLNDKSRWTKRMFIRSPDGESVSMFDVPPEGSQFCLMGALSCVTEDDEAYSPDLRFIELAIHTDNVTRWNDRWYRRHKQVLRAIDKAIKLKRAHIAQTRQLKDEAKILATGSAHDKELVA